MANAFSADVAYQPGSFQNIQRAIEQGVDGPGGEAEPEPAPAKAKVPRTLG